MGKLLYEEVILNPAHYFTHPDDLVRARDFTQEQKMKLLKAWELDVKLLQVCDEENMGSLNEGQLLSAIHQALVRVKGAQQ